MKVKAGPSSRVVVELTPQDAAFPPVALPELNLKRILVPVDFSESCRKALHYAVYFARQFNAEILLLHVVEVLPLPPDYLLVDSTSLETNLREEAAKRLSQWRVEIASHSSVRTAVRSGRAYHEILQVADENNIDLIIMGTHGRKGLAHLFMGSTAERVVRQAPCPAMVVREREHDFLEEPAEKRALTAVTKRRGRRVKTHMARTL